VAAFRISAHVVVSHGRNAQESTIKHRNPLWQSRRVLRIPLGCSRGEFEQRTRQRARAVLDERTLVDATARAVAETLGIVNVAAVVPYVRRANGDPDLAIQLYLYDFPPAPLLPAVEHKKDDDDDDDDNDDDDDDADADDRPRGVVRRLSARSIALADKLGNTIFEL
jgi:hypothetical protein